MKNHKKKPTLGRLGKKGTTALICKRNYNAFRIMYIMLILEENFFVKKTSLKINKVCNIMIKLLFFIYIIL